MVRTAAWAAVALLLSGALLFAYMYAVAISDPVVRRTVVKMSGLRAPVRLLLISDTHVAGPDMPPSRLLRLVGQLNALKPDVVLIAGDLVSDKRLGTRRYSTAAAVAPLAQVRARFGVVAVLGNHDHWRDARASRAALHRAGITILDNDAVRLGPLSLGGIDDLFTDHDDLDRAMRRLRALPPPYVLLSHSPDIFPDVPADVGLTLAGHTHCGQIRLPLVGAVSTESRFGERYACGRVDEGGRTLVVTAGLGTSVLPLRLGAAPDAWLIELRPAPSRR